jgi:3-phosphoshikimate 1-carboxyvinyltransferase
MKSLGVMSHFQNEGVLLTKTNPVSYFEYNFSDCPDLVQTVAVICAASTIKAVFTGLESLRIKETDRISALQNELSKIGAQLTEQSKGTWHLIPATTLSKDSTIEINTYDDHRMAMAFAPLVTRTNLIIENPDVVIKSYPNFWKDLHKAGIN